VFRALTALDVAHIRHSGGATFIEGYILYFEIGAQRLDYKISHRHSFAG
jgi:hypothetical protein